MLFPDDKHASITYGHGRYYNATYNVWGSDGVISLERAYSLPSDFQTKVSLQYNTKNTWDGRKIDIFDQKPIDHFKEMVDIFSMEVIGEKKSSFNIERDLLNQAKIMDAHPKKNDLLN